MKFVETMISSYETPQTKTDLFKSKADRNHADDGEDMDRRTWHPPCESVRGGDGGGDSSTIDLVFGNEGKPKSKAETMKLQTETEISFKGENDYDYDDADIDRRVWHPV